jgi:hypothetical protein
MDADLIPSLSKGAPFYRVAQRHVESARRLGEKGSISINDYKQKS